MSRRRRTVIIHPELVQQMEHDFVSSKSSQGGRNTLLVDDLFPGFLKHHDDDHVSEGPMVTIKSKFCVV